MRSPSCSTAAGFPPVTALGTPGRDPYPIVRFPYSPAWDSERIQGVPRTAPSVWCRTRHLAWVWFARPCGTSHSPPVDQPFPTLFRSLSHTAPFGVMVPAFHRLAAFAVVRGAYLALSPPTRRNLMRPGSTAVARSDDSRERVSPVFPGCQFPTTGILKSKPRSVPRWGEPGISSG